MPTKTGLDSKTLAQLKSQFDQLQAKWKELSKEAESIQRDLNKITNKKSDLGEELADIANEIAERSTPFKKGDVVVDDQGVRYRVHDVDLKHSRYRDYSGISAIRTDPGRVVGIRLTKTGQEAYARPREIVSSGPLTKEKGDN